MIRSNDILRSFDLSPSRDTTLTIEEQRIIDQDLNELLEAAGRQRTFEDASANLEDLAEMQQTLATLAFRYSVQLSPRQREIVRQYDRCDLSEIRQRVFEKIRRGEFPWSISVQ
jgi:hypothetical protein